MFMAVAIAVSPPSSPPYPLIYPVPQNAFFHSFSKSACVSLPKPTPRFRLCSSIPSLFPDSPLSHSQTLFTSPTVNLSSSSVSSNSLLDRFFDLLRLSGLHGNADLSRAIHAWSLKLEEDTCLGNALIAAYLRLGFVSDANKVFVALSCPNVVSYTTLISGFSKSNREQEAIELFLRMWVAGIEPNEYTYVAILTACIRTMDLQLALQIHAIVVKMGYLNCVFVSNALMGAYSSCGRLNSVLRLFEELLERDIASWNTVISSLVKEYMYDKAFDYFRKMQLNDGGLSIDHFTLSSLMTACTACSSALKGRQLHAHAIKVGLESHLSVGNALIGFYTNCGSLNDIMFVFEVMPTKDVITFTELISSYMEFGLLDMAVEVFNKMPERNCISHNAVLSGFSKNGEGFKALEFFVEMIKEGAEFSAFSLSSVVSACGLLGDCEISKQIHGFIIKCGGLSNDCVETALFDMCTKCDRINDAERMFQQHLLDGDGTAKLTSLICGYSRNGLFDKAVSLFHSSLLKGTIFIDEVAASAILGICGSIGFQELGKQIHCHSLKSGFLSSNVGVGNATLSMYSKCSTMEDANRVFNTMLLRDIVSWNGLISGHLLQWQGDEVLAIWTTMEKIGIKPDEITFVLVMSAYKYTSLNLVDQCRSFFLSMKSVYNIPSNSEHYTSFVSVLGRWGLLEEAEETIRKMPFEPDVGVWRALLDSCRIHSNAVIGKRAERQILGLKPKDPSSYILLSNLFSAAGRWQSCELTRQDMRQKGIRKLPVQSWIIIQNKMNSFYGRDKSHPQTKDIYRGLEILILECLKAGYVPDTTFVLHEVEEHQKKDFVFYHSVKLAATYGILMSKGGKPIRIVKNVLLCGDCHEFLKYVSVVSRRKIVVRDSSGFHCFSNGHCSCKGYW